jgi:hypothetical protein
VNLFGLINDGTTMPALTSDSVIDGNRVEIRGARSSYRTRTSASTWTPDPFDAETQAMTLTSNVTVNAATLTGVTPGAILLKGQRLTLLFTQDATGNRTITWDSSYKVGSFVPNLRANAVSAISFVYDGANWIAQGYTQNAAPSTAVKPAQVASGEYIIPIVTGTSTVLLSTLNQMVYIPLDLAVDTTVASLGSSLSVVGAGTGLAMREGLYADDGTGSRPTGSPLYEGATTWDPTGATGDKNTQFPGGTNVVLPAGRYWRAIVVQGSALTTGPTLTAANGMLVQIGAAVLTNANHRTWVQSSVSGALPAVSGIFRSGLNPLLALKVA